MPTKILADELARVIASAIHDNLPTPPEPIANRGAPLDSEPLIYDLADFCVAYRVSRSKLYALWRQGLGPKTHRLGRSLRISREAAHAWVERLEAAA
jgi:predicted DNA-binding transcriptional regulator AlpA